MFNAKVNPVHESTAVRHATLRERLVDAAEASIDAGGLGEVRARDLARQAGCAVGAIYKVVADIDDLILQVSARTLQDLDQHLHDAVRRHQDAVRRHPHAEPAAVLVVLAEAYLAYAVANRRRWDALFTHRMAAGQTAPAWLEALQGNLFAQVEGPVAALWPDLPIPDRRLLARTIFSAVHGVIVLGLDQRVASIDSEELRAQLRLLVTMLATGLIHRRS